MASCADFATPVKPKVEVEEAGGATASTSSCDFSHVHTEDCYVIDPNDEDRLLLRYIAGYADRAGGGQAQCRDTQCLERAQQGDNLIRKGSLRMGRRIVQTFGSGDPIVRILWFHAGCFFNAQCRARKQEHALHTLHDVESLDALRREDQLGLLKLLVEKTQFLSTAKGAGLPEDMDAESLAATLDAINKDLAAGGGAAAGPSAEAIRAMKAQAADVSHLVAKPDPRTGRVVDPLMRPAKRARKPLDNGRHGGEEAGKPDKRALVVNNIYWSHVHEREVTGRSLDGRAQLENRKSRAPRPVMFLGELRGQACVQLERADFREFRTSSAQLRRQASRRGQAPQGDPFAGDKQMVPGEFIQLMREPPQMYTCGCRKRSVHHATVGACGCHTRRTQCGVVHGLNDQARGGGADTFAE